MPEIPASLYSSGGSVTREVARAPRPTDSERLVDRAPGSASLDRLVEEAAARITRLEPREAASAAAAGGVIIDIRSPDTRQLHGVIPGSLHIPRTVLEWRVARDSPWRNSYLGGVDQRLILVCDHGYSSILAAASLVELGFHRASDVIGGFVAWKLIGLPVEPHTHRLTTVGALPGMGGPE